MDWATAPTQETPPRAGRLEPSLQWRTDSALREREQTGQRTSARYTGAASHELLNQEMIWNEVGWMSGMEGDSTRQNGR